MFKRSVAYAESFFANIFFSATRIQGYVVRAPTAARTFRTRQSARTGLVFFTAASCEEAVGRLRSKDVSGGVHRNSS